MSEKKGLRKVEGVSDFIACFNGHNDAYEEWHRLKNLYDFYVDEKTKQVHLFLK